MTKEAREYNGEITVSSTSGIWKTGQIHAKRNETGPLSYTIYKNKLKWIKDINVRFETIELLEEKIGSKLFDMS